MAIIRSIILSQKWLSAIISCPVLYWLSSFNNKRIGDKDNKRQQEYVGDIKKQCELFGSMTVFYYLCEKFRNEKFRI